ncbi:MAG: hypothetical protein VKN13_07810 [Cyanobacteriota bacterium]|nr:hypothetical protein [Cyanobacteriota bacterium]
MTRNLIAPALLLALFSQSPLPIRPAAALPDFDALQEQGASRTRAANLARMQAERLNGGLERYRPEACMFERGGGACFVEASERGLLFRFRGGPPGWQQLGLAANRDTEILIAPDGRSVLEVVYNGDPR